MSTSDLHIHVHVAINASGHLCAHVHGYNTHMHAPYIDTNIFVKKVEFSKCVGGSWSIVHGRALA